MFLLDTNVVSELMRAEPAAEVVDWMNAQAAPALFLSAVALAALELGIALLPEGRRRQALRDTLHEDWLAAFEGRVLAFEAADAAVLGPAVARSRQAGVTMEFADAALAAQAIRHGFTLATRNTKDFRACGVALVNPWEAKPTKAARKR
jgi:toxin FitB